MIEERAATMPNPATNTTTPTSGSFGTACEPHQPEQWRIPMHVPKPLMAVSLAVLSIAVTLGCFAQVF
jgi:hypothetical protein